MKLSKFQFLLVFSCDGAIKLTNCWGKKQGSWEAPYLINRTNKL